MSDTPELFYVQCIAQGYMGNCSLFWCTDRRGYTTELDKAGKYTREQVAKMRPDIDVAWPVEYVDKNCVRHFRSDMSGIDRPDGMPEPARPETKSFKHVEYREWQACELCGGTGRDDIDGLNCSACHGRREVEIITYECSYQSGVVKKPDDCPCYDCRSAP